MKKYRIELTMACLLLVCFYLLSRQAAVISVNQAETTKGEADPLILVDAGHGGSDPGMIGMGRTGRERYQSFNFAVPSGYT